MGYFDGLASSSFKATEDGQMFFFPWGTFGSGYVVASVAAFDRLRQYVKVYVTVSLLLTIAGVLWNGLLGGIVASLVLVTPYVLWARFECRHLVRTNERLSLQESVTAQARAYSTLSLSILTLIGSMFVAVGMAIIVLDPESWLLASGVIVFFGLATANSIRLLVLKHKSS
jgi:hypothetical protein